MKKSRFHFEYASEVSQAELREIWEKNFADKPFPQVKAFEVTREDLIRFATAYMDSHPDREWLALRAQRREHGKAYEGITKCSAIALKSTKDGYLIFRWKDSPNSLEKDMTHELRHIYNGDINPRALDKLWLRLRRRFRD